MQTCSSCALFYDWLRIYFNADYIVASARLTVLPQGLAYSTLAGLEPQYGLYSAFIGGVVYAFIGGCREVTIGPTALLALMTSRHTGLGGNSGPHLAVLLCFLAGIVEFVMALLKLGALVDLISLPVTIGFTSATALIIGSSQLKGLLGIQGSSGGSGFTATIKYIFEKIHELRPTDTLLGVGSIAILLLLRKLKDIKTPENASQHRKLLGGALWLISTARNAIIVILSSFVAYYCYQQGQEPFILTGKVKSGLPGFDLPPFETYKVVGNETVHMSLGDMVSELGLSIFLVPVIAVLGNVAISKAFGGAGIDATKELIALSLSNVFGSFFSSIPVTGSFSRSAVNHASGVRTPIGGIYTGILVLLALSVLTPYFRYIPRAALSAVIISAVIFMIEYEVVKPLWKCSKRELFTVTLTLVLSLLVGVEIGLLSGVLLDIAFLVQRTARPVLSINESFSLSGISYVLVKPRNSLLCFPAIEYVRNGINSAIKEKDPSFIVLDCHNVLELDYTAAKGIGSLKKELASKDITMVILAPSEEVKLVLKGSLKGCNVAQVENERDLDIFLQDRLPSSEELKQVIAPLLKQSTASDDIETDKGEY